MKAKSIVLLAVAHLMCIGISAQPIKEKRVVTSFQKVAASSGIDVYFTQSNTHSVEIEADTENMNKIEVKVSDNGLSLKIKQGERFKKNSKIVAYVSAPTLEEIAISGGSDFDAKEVTSNGNLAIATSGGSDININKVKAIECNFAFSGGSDCEIKELNAQKLKLAASGGSDAEINANNVDEINAAVSGGADLKLSGKAKIVSIAHSGGAEIDIARLSYETLNKNK